MHRHKLVALVGIITLAIAGCASEETPPVATSPSPGVTAASPAVVASPTATAPLGTNPATAQPLVAQRPGVPAAVPGLIQPTNADERTNQVKADIKASSSGRNPFAGLPPAPSRIPATTLSPVPKVAQLPAGTGGGTSPVGRNLNTPTAAKPNNSQGSPSQPKQAIAAPAIPKVEGPLGYNIPPANPKSALPPRPSTDIAQAVEITGVITVGATPQVIVMAPGDASSRYVTVGQRISNGKVLVKRIESSGGSDPIVVLEENGVEVTKSIGEKGPAQTAKPTA